MASVFIILQLFLGSYLVFLMDEVVSKWGIGSGISLFIAAGVAEAIFTGTINWIPVTQGSPVSLSNPPSGAIPKTIFYLVNYSSTQMSSGGLETILFQNPNPLIALAGTIAIFLFVSYIESAKDPNCRSHMALQEVRGAGTRSNCSMRRTFRSY